MKPGQTLGAFTCVRALRSGGMAQLFVARRTESPHDLVVIKQVLPALGCDQEFVRMFEKEARIGRTLEHPNIARMIESGLHEGSPYMVVEHVHGVDLRRLLKQAVIDNGALPLGVALGIGIAVAEALHYAHEHAEVVHRDVDPTNVLIAYDGSVKLVDFGIARTMASTHTTRASWIKGKAGYMAPEQCLGEHLDRRTDVFALGILLYEMTTGYRLFHGATDYETTSAILTGEYTPPGDVVDDYPPQLEAMIARALEHDPDRRWATAEALGAALAEFAQTADLSLDPTDRARCVAPLLETVPASTTAPAPTAIRARGHLRNVALGAILAVPFAAVGLVMARPDPLPTRASSTPETSPPPLAQATPQPRLPSPPEPELSSPPETPPIDTVAEAVPQKRAAKPTRPRRAARLRPGQPPVAPQVQPVQPATQAPVERRRPTDTILPPSWTGAPG